MLWLLGGAVEGDGCGGMEGGVGDWGWGVWVVGGFLHPHGSAPWRHFGYLLSWFVVIFCLSFEVLAA